MRYLKYLGKCLLLLFIAIITDVVLGFLVVSLITMLPLASSAIVIRLYIIMESVGVELIVAGFVFGFIGAKLIGGKTITVLVLASCYYLFWFSPFILFSESPSRFTISTVLIGFPVVVATSGFVFAKARNRR